MKVRSFAVLCVVSCLAVTAQANNDPPLDDGNAPPPPPTHCTGRQPPMTAITDAVDWSNAPPGSLGLMVAYIAPTNAVTYAPFGLAESGGSAPNEHTLFGIGSLSKLFTATLLGRLEVMTPGILHSAVPVPPSYTNLRPNTTYLDLADHHGGLPKNSARKLNSVSDLWTEYTSTPIHCDVNNPAGLNDCGCCTSAYQNLLGIAAPADCSTSNWGNVSCAIHPHTTGGAGFVYSNEGFAILGHALARQLGVSSWAKANTDYVTTPLGMSETVTRENLTSAMELRTANNCVASGPTPSCGQLGWLPVGNPAGGLFSTASDLVQFLRYNMLTSMGSWDPDLYNALAIIHQTYEYGGGGTVQLGWQVKTLTVCGEGSMDLVWKDGANGPFGTWIGYIPSQHRAVVVLSNSNAFGSPAMIGQTILSTAQ